MSQIIYDGNGNQYVIDMPHVKLLGHEFGATEHMKPLFDEVEIARQQYEDTIDRLNTVLKEHDKLKASGNYLSLETEIDKKKLSSVEEWCFDNDIPIRVVTMEMGSILMGGPRWDFDFIECRTKDDMVSIKLMFGGE